MMQALQSLIDVNGGSISMEQFIECALYHEKYGYYIKNNPIGVQGDFITAPEISQLFAETIAVWVILKWEELGKPKRFTLVELGPGQGTMMSDILRVTKRYFPRNVDVYLMEISHTLRDVQEKVLFQYDINWFNHIQKLPNQPTIIVANEFFDAIPIRQYVYKNGWDELHLDKNLDYILKPADDFSSEHHVKQGAIIEKNVEGEKIFCDIKKHIDKNGGGILIIDYGYVQKPYSSTLQAVKDHKHHYVLKNIGDADITAHVDFSMFVGCNITTQAEFLHMYGLKERAGQLLKQAGNRQAQNIMSSLHRLTNVTEMGNLFKVAYV